MPIVYCKNYSCEFNQSLKEPIMFNFRKNYFVPFEDDKCSGKCKKSRLLLSSLDYETEASKFHYASCTVREIETSPSEIFYSLDTRIICERIECLHQKEYEICGRGEVILEKVNNIVVCKCFSNRKISGHMNMSRFPIGGHLSDSEAEKMAAEKSKFKSYHYGKKESKEGGTKSIT